MNHANLIDINWIAVLVAAIAYFALGALWYSFLFQKKWVEYQNINVNDPEIKQGVAGVMVTSFVLTVLITTGLAILIELMNITNGLTGAKLGLLTGVCFSATVISMTYLYTKKKWGLHFIDGAYHVVGQIIAGVILCLWR
ncbi:MAG: DUF1761 domain-containing protein [Chitinophagaceae bacterium]